VANMAQLTAAVNCSHPKINTGYAVVVGGHPTWRVDARHRFYSVTVEATLVPGDAHPPHCEPRSREQCRRKRSHRG
jgi:hypothetical protein